MSMRRPSVVSALAALIVVVALAAPHPALASTHATAARGIWAGTGTPQHSTNQAVATTGAAQANYSLAALTVSRVELLGLINASRVQAGLTALTLSPTLSMVAQGRSRDMIARRYFSHQIPGGGMVFDILDHDKITYQLAGENIAMNGYLTTLTLAQSIQHTEDDFWNSPEHRANVLDPHYVQVGLGMALDHTSHTMIVTEVFVQP